MTFGFSLCVVPLLVILVIEIGLGNLEGKEPLEDSKICDY